MVINNIFGPRIVVSRNELSKILNNCFVHFLGLSKYDSFAQHNLNTFISQPFLQLAVDKAKSMMLVM